MARWMRHESLDGALLFAGLVEVAREVMEYLLLQSGGVVQALINKQSCNDQDHGS